MSEFQKPYSSNVTEDTYRRIFHPYPSCERCIEAWRTKDSSPCVQCRRHPEHLKGLVDKDVNRIDFYQTQKALLNKFCGI